jgi:UrcA family protein
MLKLFSSLPLAASLAASAAQAQAPADAADSYRIAVPYGDLNLASPRGLAAFRNRVRGAALSVCGERKVAPLAEASAGAECRADFERAAESRLSLVLTRQDSNAAGTR